jgi:hypothetical protein
MAKPQKSKTGGASRPKRRGKATLEHAKLLTDPNPLERPNSSRQVPAEASKKKRAANASKEGQPAAEKPNHSSAEKPDGRALPRKRRRKQVRLSVAMRKVGLDEYMVAKSLAGLIENLGKNKGEAKVLLDALKESTRVLEPPPKAQDTSAGDGSNNVVLRHDVPRPTRNTLQDQSIAEPGAG